MLLVAYPGIQSLSYPEGVLSQMLMSLSARHNRHLGVRERDTVKEEREEHEGRDMTIEGGHQESPEISSTQGRVSYMSMGFKNNPFYSV